MKIRKESGIGLPEKRFRKIMKMVFRTGKMASLRITKGMMRSMVRIIWRSRQQDLQIIRTNI